MPRYEYACSGCSHEFETVQRISDALLTKCPECGKDDLKRLISQTSFQLKGSGWYKTDYASPSKSSSAGAEGAAKEVRGEKSSSTASDKPSTSSETKKSDSSSGAGAKKETSKKTSTG